MYSMITSMYCIKEERKKEKCKRVDLFVDVRGLASSLPFLCIDYIQVFVYLHLYAYLSCIEDHIRRTRTKMVRRGRKKAIREGKGE